MTQGAVVAPLDDEQLLAAVHRTIREVVLPAVEGTDEHVRSQVKGAMSMVGFVMRGLDERRGAAAEANAQLVALYEARPDGSAWSSPDPGATGRFLAAARRGAVTADDRALAADVRQVLLKRLRAEVRTRAGRSR